MGKRKTNKTFFPTILRLSLFCKKVAQIERTTFANYLPDLINQNWSLSWKVGQPLTLKHPPFNSPQFEDSLGNFLHQFRLFDNARDGIKASDICELILEKDVAPAHSDKVRDAKKSLDDFLSQKCPFVINEMEFTNEEIFESLIYGEYSHINHDKMLDSYSILNDSEIGSVAYRSQFFLILMNSLSFLRFLRDVISEYLKTISIPMNPDDYSGDDPLILEVYEWSKTVN